jgi:uncharacterized membrane protein YbhN (UPF0104 family)
MPWIGGLAGLALLAWILRGFDLARFLAVVAGADPAPLVVLPVAVLVQALVRAEKWRHMVSPLASVSRTRLFGAIMGGYATNMITPVRVSPLVRAWLVARLERIPTGSVLATVLLDRMVDGFVFVGLAGTALAVTRFPDQDGLVREGLSAGAIVGLAVLIGLIVLLVGLRRGMLPWLADLMARSPLGRLPRSWRGFTGRFAAAFADGVVWPEAAWRTVAIVIASLAIQLVAMSYFLWAGLAFGVLLAPAEYLFLMVFMGFLLFVVGPLKIVGGFTVGATFALGLFGVGVETALAMILAMQVATHLTVAVAGALSLWAQGVTLATLRELRSNQAGAHEHTA